MCSWLTSKWHFSFLCSPLLIYSLHCLCISYAVAFVPTKWERDIRPNWKVTRSNSYSVWVNWPLKFLENWQTIKSFTIYSSLPPPDPIKLTSYSSFTLSKSSFTGTPVITLLTTVFTPRILLSQPTFLQILSTYFAFFLCSSVLYTSTNSHLSRIWPFSPPSASFSVPRQYHGTHTLSWKSR